MATRRASKRRSPARRRGLLVLAVAVVLAGAAAAGYVATRGWPQSEASASGATTPAPATDNPAGTSAPAEPTDIGGEVADPSSGQEVATDEPVVVTGSQVPVVMTYYGWNPDAAQVQAGGYVTGVVEDGGTCTLTLTKDGVTLTAESAAQPDAVTTACGQLVVPGDRLTAGTWQAVLRYKSPAAHGEAPAVAIEVAR